MTDALAQPASGLATPLGAAVPPTTEDSRHRLRSLDAIRGIAALLVVLGHSFEQALRFLPPSSTVRIALEAVMIEYLNFGRIGVVAFFLVSGYVIPFSFSHTRPVGSFLIARFFRLYPAYWVSVAGAIVVALILTGLAPSPVRVAANLTMVQAVLGQRDLIGVYWTLFYELLFYAVCLGAFLIGQIESPRYLLGVVILLTAVAMTAAFLRYTGAAAGVPIGIPMFLAIMHLGTLARVSDRGDGPLARRCFLIALVVVLVTAGPVSGFGYIQKASSERLIADVTSLYVGFALFFGLRHSAAICRAPLLFLGLISYSLYLFHPLALDLIVALARRVDPALVPLSLPPALLPALLVVMAVPTSAIVIAALVQRLVEAPANRGGKMVRKRILGSA